MGKSLSSDDLDLTFGSETRYANRLRQTAVSFDDADDYDDAGDGEITRLIQLNGMISVEWGELESLSLD